ACSFCFSFADTRDYNEDKSLMHVTCYCSPAVLHAAVTCYCSITCYFLLLCAVVCCCYKLLYHHYHKSS
ncbi:hypothetical protein BVRB_038390, partial [Beta vulgaris subsp. vulgaris]